MYMYSYEDERDEINREGKYSYVYGLNKPLKEGI